MWRRTALSPSKLFLRGLFDLWDLNDVIFRVSFAMLMYYDYYLGPQNMRFCDQFSQSDEHIYNFTVNKSLQSSVFGEYSAEKSSTTVGQ